MANDLSMMEADALRSVFTNADPSVKTALISFFESEAANYALQCMREMRNVPPDTQRAVQFAAQAECSETAMNRLEAYMTRQWQRYV